MHTAAGATHKHAGPTHSPDTLTEPVGVADDDTVRDCECDRVKVRVFDGVVVVVSEAVAEVLSVTVCDSVVLLDSDWVLESEGDALSVSVALCDVDTVLLTVVLPLGEAVLVAVSLEVGDVLTVGDTDTVTLGEADVVVLTDADVLTLLEGDAVTVTLGLDEGDCD